MLQNALKTISPKQSMPPFIDIRTVLYFLILKITAPKTGYDGVRGDGVPHIGVLAPAWEYNIKLAIHQVICNFNNTAYEQLTANRC